MMYIPLYSSTIMFQILLEKGKKSKQSLQTKLWFSIETTVSSQFMWEKFWEIFVFIEKSKNPNTGYPLDYLKNLAGKFDSLI